MANPIRDSSGNAVRYGERDVIGVEGSGDPRGINAELAFLREIHAVQTLEHDANGVHATPQVPRAVMFVRWTGTEYVLLSRSYLLGTYGSNVATLTQNGVGLVQFDLAEPLNTISYGIADITIQRASDSALRVQVTRASITDEQTFEVQRWDNISTPADGDFAFRIFEA